MHLEQGSPKHRHMRGADVYKDYESPLDNNIVCTPRIGMQNLMDSIYNSFSAFFIHPFSFCQFNFTHFLAL